MSRATITAARVGRGFAYGFIALAVSAFAGAPGGLWLGVIGLFLIVASKGRRRRCDSRRRSVICPCAG